MPGLSSLTQTRLDGVGAAAASGVVLRRADGRAVIIASQRRATAASGHAPAPERRAIVDRRWAPACPGEFRALAAGAGPASRPAPELRRVATRVLSSKFAIECRMGRTCRSSKVAVQGSCRIRDGQGEPRIATRQLPSRRARSRFCPAKVAASHARHGSVFAGGRGTNSCFSGVGFWPAIRERSGTAVA